MSLDDFTGSSRSSSGGGGGGGKRTTEINFSLPYLMLIQKADETIVADVGPMRIVRPEDDPEPDYEVVCSFEERRDWRNFCNEVEREFDLDAQEILEKNPAKIRELKSELPKAEPRSPTRTCAVCGEEMSPDSSEFTELKLARDGIAAAGAHHLPVHDYHTVEEVVTAKVRKE